MFDYPTSYDPKPTPNEPWEKCFAWLPVELHGKYKWMTYVYRRRIKAYGDQRLEPPLYEYGNLFDVIKDEE